MDMLARGNTSDAATLHARLGRLPRALPQALAAAPAYRADRWLARMVPVRAALIVTLAAVWIGSGLASFALPPQQAAALLAPLAHGGWAVATTWAGAALDILLGIALLRRRYRRRAAQAQIIVLLVYTLLATLILPGLWADPFGSLLKNLGLFAATWALLAVED